MCDRHIARRGSHRTTGVDKSSVLVLDGWAVLRTGVRQFWSDGKEVLYMNRRENQTWGEASLFSFGFLFIMIGVIGLLPGVPTYPGSTFAKFIVFLIAGAFTGVGVGMIWLSSWLEDRRWRMSMTIADREVQPVPKGVGYRALPRSRRHGA